MENNKDFKINIISVDNKPVYHTITKNYKPVNISQLSVMDRVMVMSMISCTFNKVVNEVHNDIKDLSDGDLVKSIEGDSSTGEVQQSESVLYVYYNKCKVGYGSGVAIVVANNKLEAHTILCVNVDEFKSSQYDANGWFVASPSTDTKPSFITEHSYQE